jgi:phage tail sheath protein FI
MAYLRPGVYVEDTLNAISPVGGAAAGSVAAFMGATDKGPTVATLVTSWSQYTSLYGSWGTLNDVTTAVYLFFANGGSQCYISRVTASDAVAATRTFNDTNVTPAATLALTAKNPGAWGNSINVTISASVITGYFDVTVFYNGTTDGNIVERFTDVTMLTTDPRYAVSVINGASTYLTATDSSPSDSHTAADNPATTANAALSTGANGTALTTTNIAAGTSKFDTVDVPLVLNVPGLVATTDVNSVITYVAARGDIFLVIDPIVDTVSAQLTRADAYTASSQAAVYYPSLTIADPTTSATGATKVVPPGGAVVGQFMATDAARGVFKSPAGLSTRLAGALSVSKLTNAELDSLNNGVSPVNAIRYIPGSGIVIMGARTLKPGYADRYVSVRRSLIYLRKSLSDMTQFAIFEPNDFRLWRRVSTTIESFLTDFWAQGGLRGATPADAFFVKCDAENNPLVSIENGQVNIEVGVALQRPAEFVVIRISQYDSGAVVTIA